MTTPDSIPTGSGLTVGMDVGGTKAAVRATDARGRVVADVVLSSAEWDAEPADAAAQWLVDVLARALPTGETIRSLAIGAQGLDRAEVALGLEEALRAHGHALVRCVNDAALLVPAAGLDAGIGLIAGTGAIGVGTDESGTPLVTGGWGWVIGDEAGAAGLVREAARSALLAHDDGDPDDGLLGALLSDFGVADAERLARAVNDDPTMSNWAPHAPAVFRAADAGSALAAQVVAHGAAHLVRLVDQLRRRGASGTHVVAAGGVITAQPRLADGVRVLLAERHPDLRFVLLIEQPVAGAWFLADRLGGGAPVSA
ncbi:BadF/BadG/BcrA/BcrD ATPase family protein [Microbacterium oxydans]|uniref:BadF/BadG/BcrA/BcrD ATPase family protein n=1 Tax=Microbacterium oxydans TaxID=82380 RepID=A0A0F0KPS2_9MICO|nr:BadF/BadG/BcrA/BcrD ATPase family protein [Microbacterium oxydans]KJL22135.1 BadF/BadG/BcrA/BcrD ATPase family protein [Microbacterium oxydans]